MIDSQADVRMDVVNLPLPFRIEAIRFRLFGAGPSARSSLAQKHYNTITEHAKCVLLGRIRFLGHVVDGTAGRNVSSTAHAQQESLRSALSESPGWVN